MHLTDMLIFQDCAWEDIDAGARIAEAVALCLHGLGLREDFPRMAARTSCRTMPCGASTAVVRERLDGSLLTFSEPFWSAGTGTTCRYAATAFGQAVGRAMTNGATTPEAVLAQVLLIEPEHADQAALALAALGDAGGVS